MHWVAVVVLSLCSALAIPVDAQVHRCKDGTGKLSYSDRPCDSGQAGALIEPRKTNSEIYQERIQAYDANLKKQQRNMAEMERTLQEQNQRSMAGSYAPVQTPPKGYAQRLAERNANVSSSLTRRDVPRPSEPDPQSPSLITHCDPGFCYDDQGGVYHKAGPDFMTGPNGRACHRAGGMWNCN